MIEEVISGAASEAERAGIELVMEVARARRIRKVLVHEVSRIARRNSTSHLFLEELELLGVSIYWHAQRIETLLPSGRRNPAASIMFSLLAEMARSARETLIDRINSGKPLGVGVFIPFSIQDEFRKVEIVCGLRMMWFLVILFGYSFSDWIRR